MFAVVVSGVLVVMLGLLIVIVGVCVEVCVGNGGDVACLFCC